MGKTANPLEKRKKGTPIALSTTGFSMKLSKNDGISKRDKNKKKYTIMRVTRSLDEYSDLLKSEKKLVKADKRVGSGKLRDNESNMNETKIHVGSTKKRKSLKPKEVLEFQEIIDQSVVKDVLEKYKISLSDIRCAIDGAIKFQKDNPKMKNQLFDGSFPLSLSVNCHRIPRGHPKLLRVPLKHSLLTEEDDICLIASEVKGIGNKEHDKHIEHYEKLLAAKGVTNIKKIMTFHEFRTEHETFEQKSRLVDLYDVFLVCGKISGKVVKKCGKMFYKKRKVPIPVKLQASKLKNQIDQSLSKSFFHLHLKGDSYNLQFGHSEMETGKIIENFLSVIEFLNKNFPGGMDNVKGLFIFAPRSTSIPVFMSAKPAKEVGKITTNTNKHGPVKTCRGELSTLPNAEVIVKPSGQVIVKRMPDEHIEIDDEKITDEDIIQANKEEDEKAEIVSKNNEKLNGQVDAKKTTKKIKDIEEDMDAGSLPKSKKIGKEIPSTGGDKKGSKKRKPNKEIIEDEEEIVSKKKKKVKNHVDARKISVKETEVGEEKSLPKKKKIKSKDIVRESDDKKVSKKKAHTKNIQDANGELVSKKKKIEAKKMQ